MKENRPVQCAEELWRIFERTGSIAAYILFTEMKKKNGAKGSKEDTVKK